MKKLKIKTVENNISKGLLLKKTVTILLGVVFLNLHLCNLAFAQSNPRFYYYAYDEITPLQASNNKAVVKLVEGSTVSIESLIASSGFNPSSFQIETVATGTFIVSYLTDSTTIQQLIDSMKTKTEVHTVQPVYIYQDGLEMGITDEIVVKFKADVSESQIQNINALYGVTVKKTTVSYALLSVPVKGDALDVANSYQTSGLVKFAHPNFLAKAEKCSIPNDPYFVYQWYLHNTGQICNDGHAGTADADVDAPEAWDITTGSNTIIVAVIDDGVTDNHPDLPSNRQVRLNGSNFAAPYDGTNANDPSPVGNDNHGNACAGIIAAEQDNNEGVTGIAPNCKIMPVRIPYYPLSVPVQVYADAINFAWQNGAHILSNSWVLGTHNPNLVPVVRQAIEDATIYGRSGLGAVVVFAAGNTADYTECNPGYITFPANVTVPNVITVGASDRNDMRANYSPTSNPASSDNQIIDIVAPSHKAYSCQIAGESFEVWSIDIPGNAGDNPAKHTDCGTIPVVGEQLPNSGTNFLSYTGRMGGTSAATPLVSGIAALMLSVNPCLTGTDVFYILTNTAEDVGGYIYTGGISNELGAGRVNAYAAVSTAAAMYNAGVDLYMKDQSFDFGIEPNPDTGPMWVSEDIWVRNQNDGFTTQVHQNPEYSATFPNYVYVKIQNKGCEATLGGTAEQLELRWAKAATNLSWPDNWDGSVDLDPDPFVVALAGDIVSTQTIPIIQPGSFKILEFPWFAPDPDIYSGINTEPWHFCLLARILASNDPMTFVETSDIYSNVRNNNNIVWKNVTVVDIFPYAIPTSSIMVRNGSDVITVTKLKFDIPNEEDAYPFLNYGSIKLNLGHALFQKWDDGGRVGYGIEVCSDSIIHLLSPHAWIGNISFNSQDAFFIKAFFDLIILPEECNLNFDISQYTSDTASGDKLVGGNRFTLNTCNISDTTTIHGVLTENPSCSGAAIKDDTLQLVDIYDNIVPNITAATTDSAGKFNFNMWELQTLDTTALFGIKVKSGYAINDTMHKTIKQWINESSLNLYYTTMVNQEWVARYNGADSLNDGATALDLMGNIYVTGASTSTSTDFDMLTIKYDSSGTQKWAETYNANSNHYDDVARAITVDSSGNVYITGESTPSDVPLITTLSYTSSGTLRWVQTYQNPSGVPASAKCILQDHAGNIIVGGTSVCLSPSGKKIFTVLKYNPAGNLLWSANYTHSVTVPVDSLTSLAVDDSDNVYASGDSKDLGGNFDMVIVKFNSSGSQLWAEQYDNPDHTDDYAYSNIINNDGKIVVTGYSSRSSGNDEVVVINYNPDGSQNWLSVYNTDTHDLAYKALCNNSNEIYIGGNTIGTGSSAMLTLKYNAAGNLLWDKHTLTTALFDFKSAALDVAGNYYATGTTANVAGAKYITTQKLNSESDVQWTKTYNVSSHKNDIPTEVKISAYGNVYVSGYSLGDSTGYDFITLKYSQCPLTASNLKINNTSSEQNNATSDNSFVQVIPNPNDGNMLVVYKITENTTGTFNVYDMMGKQLLSYPLYTGTNTLTISRTDLDQGIYFYRAIAGNKIIGKDKIVVIK